MQSLPVDALLPEVVESLRRAPNLVIEAPPGAGKTTRVPAALLEAGLAGEGEVWVLEPRRLAARLAARRVAEERGERVGETVGYQVRFDEVAGPRTRLRFLTEGVFTRRLLSDPLLARAGVVVLDEFHERHLQADLALALLKRLQDGTRNDLRIVAMSATLDPAPLALYLDDCPVLRSEGRRFEVEVAHLALNDERPLEVLVESAVRRLVAEGLEGDVLVFLPGAAEIRRAQGACASVAAEADLIVLPLHGEMPASEQDRAVSPAARRKLILSTNVAESSVTIEGVAAVIDSGLARVAGHSPWSGLPVLNVARVSRASAVQRAGRAGRTRAGRCLRLYTAQDFAARPAHEAPEIQRLDLAETVLELSAAGVGDLRGFDWFEAPSGPALDSAQELLQRLGALGELGDGGGELSALGRRLLRFPLHPRLARIVVEAEGRGVAREACAVAALVSERDIRAGLSLQDARERQASHARSSSRSGASDLLELLDLFESAAKSDFSPEHLRGMGLNPNALRAVEKVTRQLRRLVGVEKDAKRVGEEKDAKRVRAEKNAKRGGHSTAPLTEAREKELLISILAGYPDRVARRRAAAGGGANEEGVELLLSGGGGAQLAPESVVRGAEFVVAIDAEERRQRGRGGASARGMRTLVRLASAIEPEWLLDLFAERIRETTEARWNARSERVEAVRRLVYDQLVLEEWRAREAVGEEVSAVLAEAALAAGIHSFVERDALERFIARVEFVARTFPEAGIAAPGETEVRECFARLCVARRSFAELRAAVKAGELNELLRSAIGPNGARLLAKMAPERVALAGGRQVRVHYEPQRPPFIASRLQDFFGMTEGPKVAGGRVAVVLQLLAPNQRPVQMTTDLAGFWTRHYPSVRQELSRRYPRHAWPENPLEKRKAV
ncbi:MAG: ATP-dependent helicase HrpB [Acidobacteria bacterium]|nr:ATP-dependent helicase HrpB [Acidobacteriota bacterium]